MRMAAPCWCLLLLGATGCLGAAAAAAAAAPSRAYPHCDAGPHNLQLEHTAHVPAVCRPSDGRPLEPVVLECFASVRIRVKGCKLLLRPRRDHTPDSRFSCRTLSAFGNITADGHAQLFGIVDVDKLDVLAANRPQMLQQLQVSGAPQLHSSVRDAMQLLFPFVISRRPSAPSPASRNKTPRQGSNPHPPAAAAAAASGSGSSGSAPQQQGAGEGITAAPAPSKQTDTAGAKPATAAAAVGVASSTGPAAGSGRRLLRGRHCRHQPQQDQQQLQGAFLGGHPGHISGAGIGAPVGAADAYMPAASWTMRQQQHNPRMGSSSSSSGRTSSRRSTSSSSGSSWAASWMGHIGQLAGRRGSRVVSRQLTGAVVTSGPLHATLLLAAGEGRWVLQPGPRCNYTFSLHHPGSSDSRQPVVQMVSGAKPQPTAAPAAAKLPDTGAGAGGSRSTVTTTSSSSNSSNNSNSRGVGHRPYASQVAGIIALGVGGPLLLCACLAAVAYRRSLGDGAALVYRRVSNEDEGVEVTPLTNKPLPPSLAAAGGSAAAAAAAARGLDPKKHTPPVSQSDTPQSEAAREERHAGEGDTRHHAADQ